MSIYHTFKFILQHPLNRNNRLSAIIKFCRWQVGSRIIPGEFVYTWLQDSKFIVRHGETGLTQNIYCGLQEFTDMMYVLHSVTEDDLFVDIGANAGAYTILACAVKKAQGYCFEPIPSTYARLQNNIYINKLNDRVQCFNIGLADKEDVLLFTSSHDTTNHVIKQNVQSNDSIKVKVYALDEIMKDKYPSILKIDVEGYEFPVINGSKETLNKPSLKSIIIELNASGRIYGFIDSDIISILENFGFNSYSYNPLTRKLTESSSKNQTSGNLLFIRDIDYIQEKVSSATKIMIKNGLWL